MVQLCRAGIQFSAIFAANDISVFGARLALYRQNIRVAQDVSIMGFDDQTESAFLPPHPRHHAATRPQNGRDSIESVDGLDERESC